MSGLRLDVSIGVISDVVADQANGATPTGEAIALDGDVTAVTLNPSPTDTQSMNTDTPQLSQQQTKSLAYLHNRMMEEALKTAAPAPSQSKDTKNQKNQTVDPKSTVTKNQIRDLRAINAGQTFNPTNPKFNKKQLQLLLSFLGNVHSSTNLNKFPNIRADDINVFLKMTGKHPLNRRGVFRTIGGHKPRPLGAYAALNSSPQPTSTGPKTIYLKGEQSKTLDKNAAPIDSALAPTQTSQLRDGQRYRSGLIVTPGKYALLKTMKDLDGEHLKKTMASLKPRPEETRPTPPKRRMLLPIIPIMAGPS